MKLEIAGLSKNFGGVMAVSDVSFVAAEGTITTILGPNGAGKTTLFNLVMGVLPATAGTVRAGDIDISGWPTYAIARHGVSRTFQKLRIFDNLSVRDNVSIAAHSVRPTGWFSAVRGSRQYRTEMLQARTRATELLEIVGLPGKESASPAELPHGEQRLLEIARAMALDPKILLLDEPMAGLNDREAHAAAAVASQLRDQGLTVVMIEHHVDAALSVSDHTVVLDFGKKIFEGTPAECRRDPGVRKAYLGGTEEET